MPSVASFVTSLEESPPPHRCLEADPPNQECAQEEHGRDLGSARGGDRGWVVAGLLEPGQGRVLAEEKKHNPPRAQRDPGRSKQDQDRAAVAAAGALDRSEEG